VVADLHDEEPHLFIAAGTGGGKITAYRDLAFARSAVAVSRCVSLLSIQAIGGRDRRGSGGRGCLRWASLDPLYRGPRAVPAVGLRWVLIHLPGGASPLRG
jgi:hypothetical protein